MLGSTLSQIKVSISIIAVDDIRLSTLFNVMSYHYKIVVLCCILPRSFQQKLLEILSKRMSFVILFTFYLFPLLTSLFFTTATIAFFLLRFIYSPTNDLSIEMEGNVARDAHRYANAQWGYITKKQNTAWGRFVDRRIPDSMDVPRTARVTVSAFPEATAAEFPPFYTALKHKKLPSSAKQRGPSARTVDPGFVPVITMGRYGVVLKNARPSDDAFVAMFNSAQTIIRCALQDVGPPCIPTTKMTLPGTVWPEKYLNAMAHAMWTRGVDVEIVLSNPMSIPDGLAMKDACYGIGWSCVDVAAELIKCIQKQFPDAPHNKLRETVQDNLRVCFVRCRRGGCNYSDGGTLGLHSKHFIIDDVCCYIGSQNLYSCDLAEWGVVIDSPEAVADIKKDYWDKLWEVSYTRDDCDVDEVMDGLGIDRAAMSKLSMTKYELQQAKDAMKANIQEYYEADDDESDASEGEEDEAEKKNESTK